MKSKSNGKRWYQQIPITSDPKIISVVVNCKFDPTMEVPYSHFLGQLLFPYPSEAMKIKTFAAKWGTMGIILEFPKLPNPKIDAVHWIVGLLINGTWLIFYWNSFLFPDLCNDLIIDKSTAWVIIFHKIVWIPYIDVWLLDILLVL